MELGGKFIAHKICFISSVKGEKVEQELQMRQNAISSVFKISIIKESNIWAAARFVGNVTPEEFLATLI